MPKGKLRHMFPGGNTSQGFFSNYQYILPQEEAQRIFVIKGGPGVGKSSMMKYIGNEMLALGYDVEFMHCSSDPNSLDGIVIPEIKVAMLDGTSPHVVDPKNPGVVDEIIHLGDYWNEDGMLRYKDAVMNDNREVGRCFARAYRYIRAAYEVYEDNEVIASLAMDKGRVNLAAAKLIENIFGDIGFSEKEGTERRLFASAITPLGLINYFDSLLTREKVYIIRGYPGTGTEVLLERVKQAALERGFYVEGYYCALKPSKLEHLIIPGVDVCIATFNEYHYADIKAYSEVNLNEYLNVYCLDKYKLETEFNQAMFDQLMDKAVETIKGAKRIHDRMESYYIPNMDFEAVGRLRESVMARILEYAKKAGR